ncbi:PLP-dependent aminotransferase family protein [Roseateles sp. BYS180W]|uniref:PLP-dependent aminotransferase family protein n=1 Tax=Roseateles rivi TaxID=3299028 RepID=A0ABW7FQT1_9BURK
MNPLQLERSSKQPLTEQLAGQLSERITQGLLAPGSRLLSVRECARRHGISPSTVVAAYDQLLARGLVEARKQRGFFVRPPGPRRAAPQLAPLSPAVQPLDATALIRSMFEHGGRPAPGLGTLPATWLDGVMLQSALRKALNSSSADSVVDYGDPLGDAGLREALSQRLAELGIVAAPKQILTTVGATQALDLVTRALLRPGDAVLVDDPGWAVEYARLSQAGMQLLPVPRGAQGPDLAVMEQLIAQHRPRLYATVSVLHNPTGSSISLSQAHQLLKLAEAADLMIVEDDTYAAFAPPHLPRLAALDGLQRTIYISGFSKMLSPGWRVGFLAAPPQWQERLVDMKLLSTLTTPAWLERAVAHCLRQGLLRRHAERVLAQLEAARERTVKLALAHGVRFVTPPAGLFGWVDVGVDSERLGQRLREEGWLCAPGSLFSPQREAGSLMRINFASSQDAAFWKALVRCRETLLRSGSVAARLSGC